MRLTDLKEISVRQLLEKDRQESNKVFSDKIDREMYELLIADLEKPTTPTNAST